MDVQQFEQAILKMAFETDARITTASVAYYLGIPSKKANELLEQLLDQGVLELDSDDEGNLYYHLPNQGDAPAVGGNPADDSWDRLEAAADAAAGRTDAPPAETDDDEPAVDSHFVSSIDDNTGDAGDDEPFSPTHHGPHPQADGASTNANVDHTYSTHSRNAAEVEHNWFDDGDNHDANPYYTSKNRSRQSRFEGVPEGVASRIGRTDARVDNSCGGNSVVVENAASCEPRPLADSKPTVTSCNDVDNSRFSTHQEYGSFGFTAPSKSTALAKTSGSSEMTLAADNHNHIEQPEHQPGMALLLSLILCGTGQIYNGEVSKGIIMLILCFLLWFVFLGWVVHIWSIVDAVVVAERINRKSGSSSQG